MYRVYNTRVKWLVHVPGKLLSYVLPQFPNVVCSVVIDLPFIYTPPQPGGARSILAVSEALYCLFTRVFVLDPLSNLLVAPIAGYSHNGLAGMGKTNLDHSHPQWRTQGR